MIGSGGIARNLAIGCVSGPSLDLLIATSGFCKTIAEGQQQGEDLDPMNLDIEMIGNETNAPVFGLGAPEMTPIAGTCSRSPCD